MITITIMIMIIEFLIIKKFILEQLHLAIIVPIAIILSFIVFKNWCFKEDNEKFNFFDEIIKATQDDTFILSVFTYGIFIFCQNKDCNYYGLILYIIVNLIAFIVYKIIIFEIKLDSKMNIENKKVKKILTRYNINTLLFTILIIFDIPTSMQNFIKFLFTSLGIKNFCDFIDSIKFIIFFYPTLLCLYKMVSWLLKICAIPNEELNNKTDELEERVEALEKNNNKINF